MKSVPTAIQERPIAHFEKADPEYGQRIKTVLASVVAGDSRQVSVVK